MQEKYTNNKKNTPFLSTLNNFQTNTHQHVMPIRTPELTFRNTLRPDDLKHLDNISRSNGLFDDSDVKLVLSLANDFLNYRKTKNFHTTNVPHFLLAEHKEIPCGYACWSNNTIKSEYELRWLSVHGAYQKQGIGRQLITELIKILRQKKGNRLCLKTQACDSFYPTRCFYDTCGFKLKTRIKHYYGKNDDCCIYTMHL